MVDFSLVEDKDIWNENILKNNNHSPYQSYGWGEYKKSMGWEIASIKANNNGNISYLQITYKLKLNMFIGWVIGSISGDIGLFKKDDLIQYLQKEFSVKYVFIKTSFTNILDFNESLALYSSGWNKSIKKINSDYTIYVDLTKSMEEIQSSCSTNFRKNVKRGIKNNIDIEVKRLCEYEENSILELFERFKQIKDVPLPNKDELIYIKQSLGENIFVATSKIDNNIVGLRAFLFNGDKALDFWATTDLVGRKNYTSFMLLFELFKTAKNLNIKEYDMSGIDTINNPTGFSFKNGLRANIVEKLGEWEISNSKLLSFFINKVYL